jgi:hypothetical protein
MSGFTYNERIFSGFLYRQHSKSGQKLDVPPPVGDAFPHPALLSRRGFSHIGKKMIRNAIASLMILLSLMFFVSLALPGVDVRVCFGYLPMLENQPPIAEARASFKPSPSEKSVEITAGDTAYFDANMSKDTDGIIVDYIWDYGDGTFGDGFFTDHVYESAGEYYVLLRVRDDKGAMSRLPSIVRVIVNPPLEVASEVRRPVYEVVITTTLAPYVTSTQGNGSTTSTTSGGSTTTSSGGSTTSTSSTSSTTTTTTTTTLPVQVLIAALKANMRTSYSDAQITSLETKIAAYQTALKNDGLNSIFLYLDEDATSNITGSKVTSPTSWSNVDGILDQVTIKLPIKYVLIVGGYNRFPAGRASSYYSDSPYADNNKDSGILPDVAIGRLPDSNNGDMLLLTNQFDTYTNLHNSGGLALPLHVGRSLDPGYTTMCFWDMIFGKSCASDAANCKESTFDSPTAVSGKDFYYLVQHGTGGPPQEYVDAILPNNLATMDVSNAVWMIVPCYGGVIDYSSTSSSIVLSYLKKGGAVHMSSTSTNCCTGGGSCSASIDGGGVGTLYYTIAKKFSVGKRIGDAYKEGKIDFKGGYGNGKMGEFYINHLYGDPTLKIKTMW